MAQLERVTRGGKVTIPYLRGQKNIEFHFCKKPFLVVFRDEEHESRFCSASAIFEECHVTIFYLRGQKNIENSFFMESRFWRFFEIENTNPGVVRIQTFFTGVV